MDVEHGDHVLGQHVRIRANLRDLCLSACQQSWRLEIISVTITGGELLQLHLAAEVEALQVDEADRSARFYVLVHEV